MFIIKITSYNMSFYVTLPSNAPSHIPNTQSDFTTFFSEPLKLAGSYEVALANINFTSNFLVNFGSLKLRRLFKSDLDETRDEVTVNLTIPNGINLIDFVSYLNHRTSQEFDFSSKSKLNKNLSRHDFDHLDNYKLKEYFTKFHDVIVLNHTEIHIIETLGLIKHVFTTISHQSSVFCKSRHLPEIFNIINYIIIYTDIIESQFFGNKKTQILRSIPISYYNGEIQSNFDNNHYVKVKDTYINSINIQLRDIWGSPIHFDDFFSYVILNLHFQPLK